MDSVGNIFKVENKFKDIYEILSFSNSTITVRYEVNQSKVIVFQ